jgi:putative ABC transport system substrate-binding protein
VIAMLANPNHSSAERFYSRAQDAARAKGVQFAIQKASTESEIDAAFASLARLHADALLVNADPFFNSRRERLVALASRYAVPAIFVRRCRRPDQLRAKPPTYRQGGVYAGRILKGEKPSELPVIQPTTFELVINLKTARALGLAVPRSLLARADEVIE